MEVKRALWLINNPHTRDYEVSMLLKNGYEVFTPKVVRFSCGMDNASVTWEYDKTLSISPEELEILNAADFYGDISQEVKRIINEKFEIAFLQYYPEQLRMLVGGFSGGIILRASGREDQYTYTEQITEDLGYGFHKRIKKILNRFWFTEMYPGIAKREGDYLRRVAQYLPVSFDGTFRQRWARDNWAISVNYPGINLSTPRHEFYLGLRESLKKINYSIVGLQPVPVSSDPKVTGSDDLAQLTHSAGLFEPETKSRALPYTAIQAMQLGIPVLYMKDGPIGCIESKAAYYGGCENQKDAVNKIRRLCRGDQRLIKRLLKDQEKLLQIFAKKSVDPVWNRFLQKTHMRVLESRQQPKRPFRIAIVMPNHYTGGVLDYSVRLTKCIKMGAEAAGDPVEISFVYKDDPVFEGKNYFKPFQDAGVPVSSFSWRERDQGWLKRTVSMDGCQMKTYPSSCWVMDNGGTNCEEADFILITADRTPGYFYSRCPVIVVAHDYIQRYVPDICEYDFENVIYQFQRQADAVFVTSKPNYINALQCGGNQIQKTYLTPLMFDLIERPSDTQISDAEDWEMASRNRKEEKRKQPEYFVWSTNAAIHKNHIRAIRALSEYYAQGGKLKCYMTGANSSLLNPKNKTPSESPYIEEVRSEFREHAELKGKIVFCGEMPKAQYIRTLEKAKFVFHPGYADNGNGTVIDAACLGVPSISSDYPASRYVNETTNIQMHFFDPFDSEDMAKALAKAEINAAFFAQQMPSLEKLKKCTVNGAYRELYEIVKKVMGIW